ncbi:MAG: glycosyltransferase family 4 protein [Pseudomonadota bacterium]
MSESKRIWATLDPFYEPGPVLGRKVANTKFLRALLAADPCDEYRFFLGDAGQADGLRAHVRKIAPDMLDAGRVRVLDRRELPRALATEPVHCMHLSDCITSQPHAAALRNRYSRDIFPITGTIHSLSYSTFGTQFLRHLWAGTTRRDAIVCTSEPGREAVRRFFDWLRQGYGLDPERYPEPQLKRIPLAVDTDELCPGEPRSEVGPVRLLVFGRISHHSKMDLLPLLRALHRLVRAGMDPTAVELVLAGWVDDGDDFLPTLKDLAANAGIPLTIVARPSEAEKVALFRSADIFVSIADNPQETFGITLVEAGAFGLPVIASDYDGYRDIVVSGETGLLVPTIGPDRTDDIDLLAPLTYDNQYHLLLAQRTAVEIPALADALKTLIDSPDMRRAMGAAARRRVMTDYSWPVVIERHVRLWDDLWREPVDPAPLREARHPQAMPYAELFGHYPSRTLDPAFMVKPGATGEAFYRGRDFPPLYCGLTGTIDPEIARKLVFLARKSIDTASLIRNLVDSVPGMDHVAAASHVLWSLKHDILERI